MRLTHDHLVFWRSKKNPAPSWYKPPKSSYTVPPNRSTIHTLINQQVSPGPDDSNRIGNLLSILRLVRKREALVPTLRRMAASPGTVIAPHKQAALCKRWLKRLGAM